MDTAAPMTGAISQAVGARRFKRFDDIGRWLSEDLAPPADSASVRERRQVREGAAHGDGDLGDRARK